MNVLIACEESQTECIEFRKLGFQAFSCDLQPCSGGYPEWHCTGDVLKILYPPVTFFTDDGNRHLINHWDLVIAHPPCTYFCRPQALYLVPGSKSFDKERVKKMEVARDFFLKFLDLDTFVAVENPVPLSICKLPGHSACAQPYEFGDPYSKLTYYWLKGLPPLYPTEVLNYYSSWVDKFQNSRTRSKFRSKSFPGISRAMASQWGDYIKTHKYKRSDV